MNNQPNQPSKTNAQQVKKQNASSAQGQGFANEFASETDVQEVKRQNSQAEARKSQASANQKSR